VVGRAWGEAMSLLFPDISIVPGGFAVVGAAALSAGTTRALSACVIIFELTGQLSYMFPVLISVIVASAVGNLLSPSVYDKILEAKGLPFLPNLSSGAHRKTGRDVMNRNLNHIAKLSTYKDINTLLKKTGFQYFPVVDNQENMLLLGEVHRSYLKTILDKREREYLQQRGIIESQRNIFLENNQTPDASPINSPNVRSPIGSAEQQSFFEVPALLEFKRPHFDPSPFQLVDRTSLGKIHFMFSMLGITHVWCTSKAHLVGVITRKEFMKKCWELNAKGKIESSHTR